MFEIGFWEISLIGIIALLVIGPDRLPGAARTVGLYVGRIRRYVSHVQQDIQRELHADELRKIVDNPDVGGLREVVDETKAALGSMREDLQEAERSINQASDQANDWAASLTQPDEAGEGGRDQNAAASAEQGPPGLESDAALPDIDDLDWREDEQATAPARADGGAAQDSVGPAADLPDAADSSKPFRSSANQASGEADATGAGQAQTSPDPGGENAETSVAGDAGREGGRSRES